MPLQQTMRGEREADAVSHASVIWKRNPKNWSCSFALPTPPERHGGVALPQVQMRRHEGLACLSPPWPSAQKAGMCEGEVLPC